VRGLFACAAILALPVLFRAVLAGRLCLPLGPALAARAGRRRERSLCLTETLFLPDRASLHVIEAGGRRLLVGRSPGTLGVLCDLGVVDERCG
jgi:hypothetical protein